VRANCKISSTQGGFTGSLNDGDLFGTSVTSLGDLDGDGVARRQLHLPGDDNYTCPS
jgi:hypothetical protein